MKTKDSPEGRKLIGLKWALKLKTNGVHQIRLVTLGHTQVAGLDFTDNFLGVASDVTLRMALIIWTVCGLDTDQLDIETAFLEGELSEGNMFT